MRPRPLLLALALLAAAACGGNSSPSCPSTCPNGCKSDGTCLQIAPPDGGGIASCPAGYANPVETSAAAAANPGNGGSYVLAHAIHTVGDQMQFSVPPGTASISIVEQAVSAPTAVTFVAAGSATQLTNVAAPHTVTSQDGRISFDDVKNGQLVSPDYSIMSAYFFSDSPATGTLTIPNTTAALNLIASSGQLPAGSWTAQISDYAYECALGIGKGQVYDSCSGGASSSSYDVTVIAKPAAGGGIPATGTLDVALYYVGRPDPKLPFSSFTAASNTAQSDGDVGRMVSSLTALYKAVGIDVNVSYHDVDEAVRTAYESVNVDQDGACAQLSQLLTHSAAGNALNIFLVSEITETTSTGTTKTVGVDGTIPGPATIGGTVASGAIVSVADLRFHSGVPTSCGPTPNYYDCGADETAYIIAHEGGHYLGLYHVTEMFGVQFDPLAGTPTCPCTTCSKIGVCWDPTSQSTPPKSADTMNVATCTAPGAKPNCGGGENLMFWLIASGSQGKLEPEQGSVMRANPAVQ